MHIDRVITHKDIISAVIMHGSFTLEGTTNDIDLMRDSTRMGCGDVDQ